MDPSDGEAPFSLVDAVLTSENETIHIECVCASVVESTAEQKERYKSNHLTALDWVTLTSGMCMCVCVWGGGVCLCVGRGVDS